MAAATHPSVVVLDGPETGVVLPIDEVLSDFSIGSDEGCHLYLSGEGTSAVHAGLFLDDEGHVTLSDTKSRRGVFVNGTKVQEHQLVDGDEISLGNPADSVSRRLRFVAIGSETDVASENLISLDSLEPTEEASIEAGSPLDGLGDAAAMPSFETSDAPAPAELTGEMPPEPAAEETPVESGLETPAPPPPRRAGTGPVGKPRSDDPLAGLAESLGGGSKRGTFVPPPSIDPVAAPKPAAKKGGTSKGVMAARLGAVALVLSIGAAYGIKKYHQSIVPPVVDTYLPGLAEPGMTMTINGSGFGDDVNQIKVTLGGMEARVLDANDSRINVTIPDALAAGGTQTVPLKVVLPDKTSTTRLLKVSVVPKVNSLTPRVGTPGDEIVLAGKWLSNPKTKANVTVAGTDAEIVEASPTVIRFKIPQITATEGQKLPVRVAVGADISKETMLVDGHLPYVESLTPEKVLPGALVTVSGIGLSGGDVDVKVGSRSAVVLSATDTELKISTPGGRLSESGGTKSVIVQIGDKTSTPRALEVHRDSEALYTPRFFAEGLADGRVSVSCEIGPVMVLGNDASSRKRAHDAAERLNSLTAPGRTARVVFSASDATIIAAGAPGAGPVLVVAQGDAAGAARSLAALWSAQLSDMFDVLLQGRRPGRTLELSPDGKVFVDIFGAARRRTGDPGVPQGLFVSPDPAWQKSLAQLASAPVLNGSQANYILDGYWSGSIEMKNAPARKVEISLTASESALLGQRTSRQGKLSTDVSLQGLSYSNRTLRFSFIDSGETLTFNGKVDGDTIDGTVSKGAATVGRLVLKFSR